MNADAMVFHLFVEAGEFVVVDGFFNASVVEWALFDSAVSRCVEISMCWWRCVDGLNRCDECW